MPPALPTVVPAHRFLAAVARAAWNRQMFPVPQHEHGDRIAVVLVRTAGPRWWVTYLEPNPDPDPVVWVAPESAVASPLGFLVKGPGADDEPEDEAGAWRLLYSNPTLAGMAHDLGGQHAPVELTGAGIMLPGGGLSVQSWRRRVRPGWPRVGEVYPLTAQPGTSVRVLGVVEAGDEDRYGGAVLAAWETPPPGVAPGALIVRRLRPQELAQPPAHPA